jgi:predicted glycosyltransferase involved in capsule biosynthesis
MVPKLTITASNRDRLQIKDCERSAMFLKSIQWQTYKDFELLIADGGSQNYDEIKEYFASHTGDIPMRIVQCKIGEAFLRAKLNNVGVRNAKAEYIMTTDVDMLFGKDFVKTLMSKVGKNILVESRTMYLKPLPAKMIYEGKIDPYNDIDNCKRGRIKKRTTAGGCQCMHINSWEKIRGFDESYVGWGSEDYDLLTRAKKAGIRARWMGESRESIMLFHLPHSRDTKKDLEYQEENKKRLNRIKHYAVNPDGWGDRKD